MRSTSLKSFRRTLRPGVLLLEAALGTGLLALFLGALGVALYQGQDGTKAYGDRVRATKLAEQTVEGARDIGTRNFSTLVSAIGQPKGVTFDANTGVWKLSGTSNVDAEFTSVLTITKPDPTDANTLDLAVTTSWSMPKSRPQSVTVKARVTNWKLGNYVGNWGGGLTVVGQYNGGSQNFNDLALVGNYAYATNAAQNNVQILDYSVLPGITAVGTVDLAGQTPVAIASKGSVLYVITTDGAGSHIRVYDASSPTAPTFVVAQDIPVVTPMQATSLVISGDFLYVGAK